MAKKEFKGGVNTLFGDKTKTPTSKNEPTKGPGPGRPKTNFEKEIRTTFVFNESLHEDLEAIAYYDRQSKKETLAEAIDLLKKKRGPEHVAAARKQFASKRKKEVTK